jgi:TPR repeat protein
MKILENKNVRSVILPLAASSGLVIGPSSRADCHNIAPLKAEAVAHLAELCDAAHAGDAGAMYWLGLAYIEGEVLNDYDRGLAWLKKASFRGNEEAARMYEFISSAQVGPGC